VLTDCDDQSYYVIKWMACLFDICKKKKHILLPCTSTGATRKKQKTKKTRAKKGNPIKTSVSGAGTVILPNAFL